MKGETINCPDGRVIRDLGDVISVFIPLEIRRRAGLREIILPDGATNLGTPTRFQVALARAHIWQSWLDEGRFPNCKALAEHLDTDRSFVRRILNLALVSPRIVEAILAENEPALTLREAMDAELPVRWGEQESLLLQKRE